MNKTQKAILQHGVQAVYSAATAHMAGDMGNGLTKVGLTATTMGEVFAIQTEAYKQMGPADQAIDNAQATAALESMAKRGHKPPEPTSARKTTNEQHIANADAGGKCPECGSSNISGDAVTIEGRNAFQDVSCNTCAASWTDAYQLTGYKPLA